MGNTKSGFGAGSDTWRFRDASHYTIVVASTRAWTYGSTSELASFRRISCHHDTLDLDPGADCHARDLDGCDKRRARGPSYSRGYLDRKCIASGVDRPGVKLGVEPCRLSFRAAAMARCCVSHLARRASLAQRGPLGPDPHG